MRCDPECAEFRTVLHPKRQHQSFHYRWPCLRKIFEDFLGTREKLRTVQIKRNPAWTPVPRSASSHRPGKRTGEGIPAENFAPILCRIQHAQSGSTGATGPKRCFCQCADQSLRIPVANVSCEPLQFQMGGIVIYRSRSASRKLTGDKYGSDRVRYLYTRRRPVTLGKMVCQFNAIPAADLVEDHVQRALNRLLGDSQLRGYLAIGISERDKVPYLRLTGRQFQLHVSPIRAKQLRLQTRIDSAYSNGLNL